MNVKPLVMASCLGIVVGFLSVYFYYTKAEHQPPLYAPSNPYESAIYATGIIESVQSSGQNINIFSSVSGAVTEILVQEGCVVKKNQPLLKIDDSIAQSQLSYSKATFESALASWEKLNKAHAIHSRSVSQNDLDNAASAVKIARASQDLAQSNLDKYVLLAPCEATVLGINVAVGDSISPSGSYDSYTRGMSPALYLAPIDSYMAVRCYVDEILISKIPAVDEMKATLLIRGQTHAKGIPLEFVRIQPRTIPKIQLSNQRQESVDVRVLPIIFKFKKPQSEKVYPGQLVDVYIRGES
jgi:HlyD family secretion protein